MTLFGVDLHPGYQSSFNFQDAAKDGCEFAFIKTSQGANYIPGGLRDYVKRAEDAGLLVGAYHFLEYGIPGADQAEHFLSVVRANGGADGRLLAVDFEDYGNLDPTNGQLYAFIRRVKRETNAHPIICYTTYNYWHGGTPSGPPGPYGIDAMWEAAVWYTSERRPNPKTFYEKQWLSWYRGQERLDFPDVPTPFRQFTWGGKCGGLYVDCDAFEGSLADLKQLTK